MRTTYDIIVIGAGHNGLAIATYLARSGNSVLAVEAGTHAGGRAWSDACLLPDYQVHPHAVALQFNDLQLDAPAIAFAGLDLELIAPEVQHGIAFRDGRPPIVIHRRDLLDKTRKSFEVYSRADAKTFIALKALADRLTVPLAKTFFGLPSEGRTAAYMTTVGRNFRGLGLGTALGKRSAAALIDDLFTAPEIRTFCYRLHSEFAGSPNAPGSDLAFLGQVLWRIGRRCAPRGGMSALSNCLLADARTAGADIALNVTAKKILVEDGAAMGVETTNDARIYARRAVVSAIGIGSTCRDLLEQSQVGQQWNRRLHHLDQSADAIANVSFCLAEAPRYSSARWDPDIDRSMQTFIGLDEPLEVLRQADDVAVGLLPSPAASVSVSSLWDPGQAPAGAQCASMDLALPTIAANDGELRSALESSLSDALSDEWQRYAPNLTPQTVLASACNVSGGSDRSLLLDTSDRSYRGPIDRLYLCGASTFPGGGVHGACAFNAFMALRRDTPSTRSTFPPDVALDAPAYDEAAGLAGGDEPKFGDTRRNDKSCTLTR